MEGTPCEPNKSAIFHEIRNCLNPLQTFLDTLDVTKEETRLQHFHQNCKGYLSQVLDLLSKLEGKK